MGQNQNRREMSVLDQTSAAETCFQKDVQTWLEYDCF